MARFLFLLSGVFFCSTSAVIMRFSELPSSLLALYRLLFAIALLSPIFLFKWYEHRAVIFPRHFLRCVFPGLLLAIHFMSWAWGARMTFVANATLIINLTPVVMPFLVHFLVRESVTRREILGTSVALGGVLLLSLDSFRLDARYFWGNVVCFGSMFTFAAYLAYGRINRAFPSIWLYMVPVYGVAAIACLIGSLVFLDSIALGTLEEAGWMLAMAVLPTILGHITLNKCLQFFAAQRLAVVNLHQFVFAGLLAWWLFHEAPPPIYYLAAALCISGAVIVVKEATRARKLSV